MEYKGYKIKPIPVLMKDGLLKVKVEIADGNQTFKREKDEFCESRNEAEEASIRFGKRMVDGGTIKRFMDQKKENRR